MQSKNFSSIKITLSQGVIAHLINTLDNCAYLYSSGAYRYVLHPATNNHNGSAGRYSILSALPTRVIRDQATFTSAASKGKAIALAEASSDATPTAHSSSVNAPTIYIGDTKTQRTKKLANEELPSAPAEEARPPFIKGWINANGYSDGCFYAGYYTWSYVYDRLSQAGCLYFSDECPHAVQQTILSAINSAQSKQAGNNIEPNATAETGFDALTWNKSQPKACYEQSFAKLKDYIYAGDCYQANLTQRFEAKSSLDTTDYFRLFLNTARASNANYCAFICVDDDHQLISFSPEQFIECHDRQLQTKPIKGTVKNSDGLSETLTAELLSDKNKAENLMIVDLLRNDLSKVAELNSVITSKLFDIESFNNVHHLVSTIKATLKKEHTAIDAFNAAFPGGSITGAPKRRAMEIIEELEAHSRRFYCGSISYWDSERGFDSNILIRTIERINGSVYCWAGGGIVADSECDSEYQESIDKVSHLTGIDH